MKSPPREGHCSRILGIFVPKNGNKDNAGKYLTIDTESNETQLRLLSEQLMLLPEASSYPQIVLCKYLEHNRQCMKA